jgi:hypothetical protein
MNKSGHSDTGCYDTSQREGNVRKEYNTKSVKRQGYYNNE